VSHQRLAYLSEMTTFSLLKVYSYPSPAEQ
jgi:hypothetical protein